MKKFIEICAGMILSVMVVMVVVVVVVVMTA